MRGGFGAPHMDFDGHASFQEAHTLKFDCTPIAPKREWCPSRVRECDPDVR